MAPKGTPKEIIYRLNAESNKALASAAIKERFLELGAVPAPLSPDAYRAFIRTEIRKWAEVVKTSGAKAE